MNSPQTKRARQAKREPNAPVFLFFKSSPLTLPVSRSAAGPNRSRITLCSDRQGKSISRRNCILYYIVRSWHAICIISIRDSRSSHVVEGIFRETG